MVTPAIQKVKREVNSRFPNINDWGTTDCRKIAGTNTWSQHAWGNAWDVAGSKQVMDQIYRFVMANRTQLGVGTVCYNRQGGCSDPHTDHLHIEGLPKMRGTPPCAGGSSGTVPPFVIPGPLTNEGSPLLDWEGGGGLNPFSFLGDIDWALVLRRALYIVLGVVFLILGAIMLSKDLIASNNPVARGLKAVTA